jgi:hypothetical protein
MNTHPSTAEERGCKKKIYGGNFWVRRGRETGVRDQGLGAGDEAGDEGCVGQEGDADSGEGG